MKKVKLEASGYLFLLICLAAIAMGFSYFFGSNSIAKIEAKSVELSGFNSRKDLVSRVNTIILLARVDIRNVAAETDINKRSELINKINQQGVQADELLQQYAKIGSAEEIASLKLFLKNWDDYKKDRQKILDFASAGKLDEAKEVISGMGGVITRTLSTLDDITKTCQGLTQTVADEASNIAKTARKESLIIFFVSLFVFISLGLIIYQLIKKKDGWYKNILNSLPVLLFTAKNGVIEFANKALLEFLGKNLEDLVGKNVDILTGSAEARKKIGEKLNQTGVETATEITTFEISGELKAIKTTGLNVIVKGRKEGYCEFATIITHLFKASETLKNQNDNLGKIISSLATSATENAAVSDTTTLNVEKIAENMDYVSSASGEMAASINEIANSTTNLKNKINNIVNETKATEQKMQELINSSGAVGSIIKDITSIAGQTNLLALNATIEAARAGESGKGFAVVANEVKELAKEAAKSAEEITNKINSIQRDINTVVASNSEMYKDIMQVNDAADTIASAIEQQSTVIKEITGKIGETNEGIKDVSNSVSLLNQSNQALGKDASELEIVSKETQKTIISLESNL